MRSRDGERNVASTDASSSRASRTGTVGMAMADSSVDGGTVTPWDQRNTILRA
jgi:hypothetical protein